MILALLLLLGGLAAPAASATPSSPQFWLSASMGRPGDKIELRQVDPCPASDDYQMIELYFIDSAGTATYISPAPWADPETGAWSATAYVPSSEFPTAGFYIPTSEAATGAGRFTAKCVDMEGVVTKVYEPAPFTVTAGGRRFSVEPKVVQPNSLVTISAADGCTPGQSVRGRLRGGADIWFTPAVDTQHGSWTASVTIPARYNHPMLGEIDFPLGTYIVEVYCASANEWVADARYAVSTLEVRTAPVRYVALGDSYSSGEGTFDYIDPNDSCHRSAKSYSYLLAAQFGFGQPNLGACSGAITQDLFYGSSASRIAQLDHLSTVTEMVTLTIGGNDALFTDVLTACVGGLAASGGNCAQNAQLHAKLNKRLSILAGTDDNPASRGSTHPLLEVYRAVHGRAPEAKIYVPGYPELFGRDYGNYTITPTGYQCWLAGPAAYITYEDAQWLNSQGEQLNLIIIQAVAAARAEGIDITYAPPATFAGHAICDASDKWLNGAVLDGTRPLPESMHPTQAGHDLGYKASINQVIR